MTDGAGGATWLWWSSGKDSAWALNTLRERGVEVGALVTTVTRDFERVSVHAVRVALLRRQAAAAGLPLEIVEIPYPCPNGAYEAAAGGLVERARALGVTCMAFGDLFLEDIRRYRVDLLAGTGVAPVFPIWVDEGAAGTRGLAERMQAAGLRACVTCLDPRVVPKALAGREWDADFLADLPVGVDPCGENGEFHTFATAGPMFREPLAVTPGPLQERDGFVFADLLPAS